jgi:hypothetical protein
MIFEISKIFYSTTMKDDKTKFDCISLLYNLSSHIPIVSNNLHSISSIFNIQSNNLSSLTKFIFEELQKICSKVQEISTILDEKINKSIFSIPSKNIPKVNFPTIPSTITNLDQTGSNVLFDQKEIQISNVIEEISKSLKEFIKTKEAPKEGILPFIDSYISYISSYFYYGLNLNEEQFQGSLIKLSNLSTHIPIVFNNISTISSFFEVSSNNLADLTKLIVEKNQKLIEEISNLKNLLDVTINLPSFVVQNNIRPQNIHPSFYKQFSNFIPNVSKVSLNLEIKLIPSILKLQEETIRIIKDLMGNFDKLFQILHTTLPFDYPPLILSQCFPPYFDILFDNFNKYYEYVNEVNQKYSPLYNAAISPNEVLTIEHFPNEKISAASNLIEKSPLYHIQIFLHIKRNLPCKIADAHRKYYNLCYEYNNLKMQLQFALMKIECLQ